MGSIDSDEFRASISDVIPTPNRNRKSLLRSFRFPCKVNGKLLSAAISLQIVRFTRGWARSTRTNSGHRSASSSDTEPEPEVATTLVPISMQSQWETTFGCYFTPNRPIYTRMGSIDSDEFRASISDVIPTPNRNRKSLLRSFRFPCKVNGKLLSAAISLQIVRFTRGWARSTRTNSGHRSASSSRHRTGTGSRYYARSDFHAKSMGNYFRLLFHSKSSDLHADGLDRLGRIPGIDRRDVIPTPNRNRKSLLRSFRFPCKVNGKLLSAAISLQIVRFTRGWARSTRTNSGHRSVTSSRHRTGTGSRYYARSDFHAKSMGNYFRLLFHSKSSDLHADGLDRLGRIPGIDRRHHPDTEPEPEVATTLVPISMQSQWETTFGCYFTPNRPIYTRMGSIDSDEFRASIVTSSRHRTGTGSRYYARSDFHAKSMGNYFRLLFHSKSSDLHADGLDRLGRIPGIDRRHHPDTEPEPEVATTLVPISMQSQWETTFGCYFTPNRPIYTRMGSIDSDEFRASISDVIPTPNRNRKSLLRSFRFPCKVNGKLLSAAISLQIVRFTRGWARSTRTNSGHRSVTSSRHRTGTGSRYYARSDFHAKSMGNYFRLLFHSKSSDLHADGLDRLGRIPGIDRRHHPDTEPEPEVATTLVPISMQSQWETTFGCYFTPNRPIYTRMGSIDSDEFRASIGVIIPTPNRNRKSLLRSFRFPCKVNGKLLSAAISLQIVRFTRGWARSTRTNSGHRSVTSSRHRTGTGSRYYARSDFHAKSMGNYFRLLFHSKSSDLHADGLDRLGRIPGIDRRHHPDTEPEPEVATTLVPISMQSQWETTFGCYFTPNRPIYTRMGSIDSDEFRASIGVIIPTPNRNRKSLLRSFRFPCKVNGKLLSAAISLQIVRFTRGWARSTRTNSGHRSASSSRHRTGTGSRYYARSDFHAKSMGNYFRLLFHSKSSDLHADGLDRLGRIPGIDRRRHPDTEPEPEVATTLVPISMQSQWETTFGCYFTPNRPIYTRMGSIDSDEFRASIGVVIPTPNRNRKSLLRSFRFPCKVNGKLLSAAISLQIVRFTRGWARSTRTNSGHRSASSSRHRTGTGSRYYARSDFHAKSMGNYFRLLFHSKSSDLHADGLDRLGRIPGIDRRHHPDTEPEPEVATTLVPISMQSQWETTFGCYFTPNRPIYTRMGSIDSDEFRASIGVIIRHRTGTGSRYYARSDFHAKSMGNYFRLLFHSKSSDLHADGLDRLGRIPGIDRRRHPDTEPEPEVATTLVPISMQSQWETTFGCYFTPNRPIYTRMGSIDSDEFRASIGVIIPTPNRNWKSLLRSFRFPCKVNGKLLSAAISLQIVRFTRRWARSTRTNSGHRSVTSFRHRTGTGSRYYARFDFHAKSMGNYFRLLFHSKSSDLHADGLDRLVRIPGIDRRHHPDTEPEPEVAITLVPIVHAKSMGNYFRLLFHSK
jgi:hypothetical protein